MKFFKCANGVLINSELVTSVSIVSKEGLVFCLGADRQVIGFETPGASHAEYKRFINHCVPKSEAERQMDGAYKNMFGHL